MEKSPPGKSKQAAIKPRIGETEDPSTELKRAQKALVESEKRYRSLLDTLQEGIWTLDAQGVTTFVNPAMARMLGYGQEEMVGKSFYDFTDPVAHQAARQRFEERMRGASTRFHHVFYSKGGTAVQTEFSAEPIYSDTGTIIGSVAAVVDITDRAAVEEAYRSLVDNSLHGLAIFQEGRIVFCNQVLAEMSGFSVADLRGFSREEAAGRIHPDDRERVMAAMEARLTGRAAPAVYTFRCFRKDGVTRVLETFSTLVTYKGSPALQVSYRDITEHYRTGVALRESEERFRSVFDQAPVGAAIVSLEYRFMRVNNALCRITGYSNEELLARGFPEITHPDDLAADVALARRLVAGEIDRYSLDKRYIRRTGEPVWVRLSVGLIRDESNNPAYFLPLVEDISERKQTETEMRGMHEKLRSLAIHLLSAREEERRKIAQEIHDELGQSLTAMKMDLRWVEKRLPPGTEVLREKLRGLVGMADQTISMVQRIAGEIRPRMLDDLGLAAALEWLGKDFQRGTGVSCDVTTDFPESIVGGNAASTLYRIVQEALTNVARHSAAHRVSVQLMKNGASMELRVEDDGVGITQDQIASPKSYGLLGIRERTQGLAGSILISGEKNRGTTVVVSVPLPAVGGLA
jgi:two-component system, NarL family, sensor histidine kinase UhpB